MTVRTIAQASSELRQAVRWYETRRAGLGGKFFDSVVATLSRIRARPESGTAIAPDGRTRRILVARFPYQVVYRVAQEEITIVAVAHLKRRPEYWTRRLR